MTSPESSVPATGVPWVSRARTRCILASIVAVTLLGGLVVVEIGFRLFVPVTDVPFVFWDPVVGLRREPNQRGRNISGRSINASFNINAQGWNHHVDYETTRPSGTVRVCLVGDSQVEGRQVDLEKRIPYVAEQLMSRPDRPVQWYSFGCAGLGTSQEYEVIRHYVLDYNPDLVILLYVQNDPFDCSPYLLRMEQRVPVYYLDENDDLQLIPAGLWKPSLWRRTLAQSALVRYFVIQRRVFQGFRPGGAKRADVRAGGLPLREEVEAIDDPRIPGLVGMSMEDRHKQTWALTEVLIKSMRNACRDKGAEFALAFRGWPDDIDEPIHHTASKTPPADDDPYCLTDARVSRMGPEIIEPMARRNDIPYLDLTDPLRKAVAESGTPHRFVDDNHYNELGHHAAAAAMAEWAEKVLLPKATERLSAARP